MPTPAPHKQPHQTQWEKVKLGDIAEITAGQSPQSKFYSATQGMPFLQGSKTFGFKYPTIDTYTTHTTKIAKKGSILISVRAPVGDLNFAPFDICIGRGLASIEAKVGTNQSLWYILKFNLANILRQKNLGTIFDSISKETLQKMNIIAPPLPTQENIAQILSTLDKKIELNTRINTELESMAKLLYTRYFVEFNFPDSSGKPYKASGGAMVYSPTLKREIPKDWEVASLNDICHLYQPKTIAEKDLIQNGKYFVYGANGIIGRYDKYNHEESEIVITCRGASCGNILRTIPQVWITGNAMVASPKNKKIHKQFIKNTLEVIGIKNTITGSAQPQITRENLKGLYVAVPNDELLEKYFSTINPIYEIFIKNQQESQRLAEWRDYLLPLLMGDQVEVV